ncbi:MAG: BatD family protein, partial [Candidatus Marinimicrobia bacterium]|nr:BatD family protein [Candidatus Neomarinimicrobiota bacterium]
MGKKAIILILLLIGMFNLQAVQVEVTAHVDKTNLSMNDIVKYTLEIKGARGIDVQRPDFKDLQIRSGPSQSSQIQIINGEMNASKSISWWLTPMKSGKIEIPSAKVKYKGNVYSSNEVVLTVSSQPQQQKSQNKQNDTNIDSNGKNVIFVAEPAKKEVYNGAQINVNFVLYFRTKIKNFARVKLPEGKNFWVEEFKSPQRPDVTQININGKQYNRAVIQQIAFFPTKAGELEIDPMQIKIEIPDPERSNRLDDFFNDPFFNDPFFSRTKVVNLSSPVEKIHVKPLPEGQPASFSGGVGQFNISADVDTNEVTENQAFTLSYKVQGKGHINSVSLTQPAIDFDCEIFEPKIDRESKKVGQDLHGILTYKYVIIPREAGSFTIPSYQFSYFDNEKGKYITKSTNSFRISVEPGQEELSVDNGSYSRDEIAILEKDIRYIDTAGPDLQKKDKHFFDYLWFWMINLTSLVIIFGTIIYKYRQRKYSGNAALMRRKNAAKRAKQCFQSSQEA